MIRVVISRPRDEEGGPLSPRERADAVRAILESKPGAFGDVLPSAGGVTLYKVMGKMFAILTATENLQGVTLKCDPHLVEILREQYAGVGHRGHLDRRFWIFVRFDVDVPEAEIARLIDHSYDLVRAGLTRKQRALLEVS
jgi:predicted DNA-binding protein (MmcQ/YjbR family)